MTIKAAHLEIVSDLSTEVFLASFGRFIFRWSILLDIYSEDCGTNFQRANRQLKDLFSNASNREREQLINKTHCKWHFNPPAAPHVGGI